MLESYFASRKQFVTAQNFNFSVKSINIGVSQGFILRALLFLFYINDMSNVISCNPHIFADDTCLNVHNSTISVLEVKCNRKMQKLHKYFWANELQINSEKSEALKIPSKLSTQKTDLSIMYNDSSIN